MSQENAAKPDEPKHRSLAESSHTEERDEPSPESARPPEGYDDPLRRERKSGMATPREEKTRDPLNTTVGDRGGAG